MSDVGVRVSGFNVFPIKSCKACRVEEIVVDKYGVVGDRTEARVSGRKQPFVFQRNFSTVTVTV